MLFETYVFFSLTLVFTSRRPITCEMQVNSMLFLEWVSIFFAQSRSRCKWKLYLNASVMVVSWWPTFAKGSVCIASKNHPLVFFSFVCDGSLSWKINPSFFLPSLIWTTCVSFFLNITKFSIAKFVCFMLLPIKFEKIWGRNLVLDWKKSYHFKYLEF